jgi:hypothetical protein
MRLYEGYVDVLLNLGFSVLTTAETYLAWTWTLTIEINVQRNSTSNILCTLNQRRYLIQLSTSRYDCLPESVTNLHDNGERRTY